MIIVNTESKTIKLDTEWLAFDYRGWFTGYIREAVIDEFKIEKQDYMKVLPLYSVQLLRNIPKGKSFLEFFYSYLNVLNKKNITFSQAFLSEVLYLPEIKHIITSENCSPLFLLLELNNTEGITLLNLIHTQNNLIKLFSATLNKQNYKENLVTWCVFIAASRISLLYILYMDIEKENYSFNYHCDLVINNIDILELIATHFSDAIIDLVVSIENNPRTISV